MEKENQFFNSSSQNISGALLPIIEELNCLVDGIEKDYNMDGSVKRACEHLKELVKALHTGVIDYSYLGSLRMFGSPISDEISFLRKLERVFESPNSEFDIGRNFLKGLIGSLEGEPLKIIDLEMKPHEPLVKINSRNNKLEQFKKFNYGEEFKNFVCPNPFNYAEIRVGGEVATCCYLPFSVGNISNQNLKEAWNSEEMQELRRSILDGDYCYCDKKKCAAMQQVGLENKKAVFEYQLPYSLFKKAEIVNESLKKLIEANSVMVPNGPGIISFEDDPSCNLSCPSCRTEVQMLKKQQSDDALTLQKKLLDELGVAAEELWFCGAGDPIAAKSYRRLYDEYDFNLVPNAKIRIDTNGMLLNQKNWETVLGKVKERIDLIAVSVDAATEATYAEVRRGGKFSELLDNLRFISNLPERKSGKIKFIIRLIVQAKNFREMKEFVALGKFLNVDSVIFSVMQNWGTFESQEYLAQAVHKPGNPYHQELLSILEDPLFDDPIVDLGNLSEQYYALRKARELKVAESVCTSFAPEVVEASEEMVPRARLFAFYLPQFHPIPENDTWWGKGFTEWTNVGKARQFYKGHYQPHVPADLGYYDLRVQETIAQQADLAKTYGVEAFCFWHYWFAGKRLLEKPFENIIKSGQPQMSFCLGWANQTWSGIWHGAPNKILIEQTYPGVTDYKNHFYTLLPAFCDERYTRINGKLVFLIYDPHGLPDSRRFTDLWRNFAEKEGLGGFHFIAHQASESEKFGCDACVANAPFVEMDADAELVEPLDPSKMPTIKSYAKFVEYMKSRPMGSTEYPLVVPNWDNTPRSSERGLVLHGSTPELFGQMLNNSIAVAEERFDNLEERIVFIKAWNEWAEGNYIEPDLKYGHGYLEAVRRNVYKPVSLNMNSSKKSF